MYLYYIEFLWKFQYQYYNMNNVYILNCQRGQMPCRGGRECCKNVWGRVNLDEGSTGKVQRSAGLVDRYYDKPGIYVAHVTYIYIFLQFTLLFPPAQYIQRIVKQPFIDPCGIFIDVNL